MSGTKPTEGERPDAATSLARRGVERAETGAPSGVDQLDEAEAADPAAATAVEQEAADGPEGRGLSR